MEQLGSRKLSELLADMWEMCPACDHNSKFFAALFSACPATSECSSLMRITKI